MEQRTELFDNPQIAGTFTSVQKDNMILEKYMDDWYEWRIRKITPLESWRIMNFTDQDFHAAEKVVSNTQLYSQAGNAIVKNVLTAIFGQMIPGKENVYREGK